MRFTSVVVLVIALSGCVPATVATVGLSAISTIATYAPEVALVIDRIRELRSESEGKSIRERAEAVATLYCEVRADTLLVADARSRLIKEGFAVEALEKAKEIANDRCPADS